MSVLFSKVYLYPGILVIDTKRTGTLAPPITGEEVSDYSSQSGAGRPPLYLVVGDVAANGTAVEHQHFASKQNNALSLDSSAIPFMVKSLAGSSSFQLPYHGSGS